MQREHRPSCWVPRNCRQSLGQEGVVGLLELTAEVLGEEEMPPGQLHSPLGQQLLGLPQMQPSKFPAQKIPQGCWHLLFLGGSCTDCCSQSPQMVPQCLFWSFSIYFWPPNGMARCCGGAGSSSGFSWLAEGSDLAGCWTLGAPPALWGFFWSQGTAGVSCWSCGSLWRCFAQE